MALAIAPRDAALLELFASSLEAQGLTTVAASVRRELAALAVPSADHEAAAEVLAATQQTLATERPAPLPPPVAAPVGPSVTIALPPPRLAGSAQPRTVESQALQVVPVGRSVTIALPPPRPALAAKSESSMADARPPSKRQPRLERLSLTEVALFTADGPQWKRPASASIRAATRVAKVDPSQLRLLNAARIDRLAARTRSYLSRYGWRDFAVGDAASVRARSLIVYPKGSEAAAHRLSARLGFATAPRSGVRQLTILLGRDAADHPALRTRA
jgi:hypothetical protein